MFVDQQKSQWEKSKSHTSIVFLTNDVSNIHTYTSPNIKYELLVSVYNEELGLYTIAKCNLWNNDNINQDVTMGLQA